MSLKKVLIVKSDITDNTKTIGDDTEFIGITEVSVDIHLLDRLVGGSMRGHRAISGFVRVIIFIKVVSFGKSLQLFDDTVCIFGIIFSDPGFYTGSIEDSHGCKSRIKLLADRFGQINQMVEHGL